MVLDSVEATKQMVRRGLGVSFLPWTAIKSDIEQGTLARVTLKDGTLTPLETSAMVLRSAPQHPTVKAFLALLKESLPNPQAAP